MTKKEKYFIRSNAKTYLAHYLLYFFLVCVMSVFSICSILSINNFLQILFYQNEVSQSSVSALDSLLNSVYSYFLSFGKTKALLYFTAIILSIYFLKDVFYWLGEYEMGATRNKITRNIRSNMFSKFIHQDVSFFYKYKKGDLLSRISADVLEYDETVLKSIQTIINSFVVVLLYLIMLFYISWKLTLISLLLFPLVASLTSMLSRKLKSNSKKLQAKNGQIISDIEQTISGLRIIKSLAAIDYVNDIFSKRNENYTLLRNKVYRKIYLASPQSEVISSFVIAIILLVGSKQVLAGDSLSSGMFIVYLILFVLIIKPAKDASTAFYNIKKGTACMNRIMEIESSENNIKEPTKPKAFPKLEKGIKFSNVYFSYGEKDVLKNINCLFEKGKTTAIVGASGSGKTTIIDLIEKFYTIKQGDILFDDVSVNDLLSTEIHKNIAVVGQDTILVNDTVSNNICFGSTSYTQQEIENAAKIANAEEFILKLPDGYQTNIGDRGDMLSGGQKQRISIARAVLKNASILILDEATSALDTESEKIVQEAINRISKDKTVIMIAHRLSTVINADKIIVLEDGEIKEEGSHLELYNKKGIYYNLYKMQEI
ncbi:MAG: ABC transporter ATP-binding protein [Bacteroidales bacterium]|nr:ABC transporter ATP-binding protein [Bacteroidales bacterium]